MDKKDVSDEVPTPDMQAILNLIVALYRLKKLPIPKFIVTDPEPPQPTKVAGVQKSRFTKAKVTKPPANPSATPEWVVELANKLLFTLMMKNASWIEHHRVKQHQSERWAHLLRWVMADGPNSIVADTQAKIDQNKRAAQLLVDALRNAIIQQTMTVDMFTNAEQRLEVLNERIELRDIRQELRIATVLPDDDDDEIDTGSVTKDLKRIEQLQARIKELTSKGVDDSKLTQEEDIDGVVDAESDIQKFGEQLQSNRREIAELYQNVLERLQGMPTQQRELIARKERYKNDNAILVIPEDIEAFAELRRLNNTLERIETAEQKQKRKALFEEYEAYKTAFQPKRLDPISFDTTSMADAATSLQNINAIYYLLAVTDLLDTPYDPSLVRSFQDLVTQHALEHLCAYINAGIQTTIRQLNKQINEGLSKTQSKVFTSLVSDTESDFVTALGAVDEKTYATLREIVSNAVSKQKSVWKILDHFTNSVSEFITTIYTTITNTFGTFDTVNPYSGDVATLVQRLTSMFKFFQHDPMMSCLPGYQWPSITDPDQLLVSTLQELREFFFDTSVTTSAKTLFVQTKLKQLSGLEVPTGTFLPQLLLETPDPMSVVHGIFGTSDSGSNIPFFTRNYSAISEDILKMASTIEQRTMAKKSASLLAGELVAAIFAVYLDPISIK